MRAVILQHEENVGPGIYAEVLEAAGFKLTHRFRSVERSDVDAELVVSLGGYMGVYEQDQHPFLGHELALLSERLAAGRPCLGVCLGAQLMAQAAGADVFPGKNGFELGALPVRWTREGLADEVLAGVRPKTVAAHWHGDSYSAVPGATLLASTDRYTQQAFRLGSSYGFQFHLELTAKVFSEWLTADNPELSKLGKDVPKLRAELPKLKAAEPELREVAERLAHHFAKTARVLAR